MRANFSRRWNPGRAVAPIRDHMSPDGERAQRHRPASSAANSVSVRRKLQLAGLIHVRMRRIVIDRSEEDR
jgi:hypothetical protein